MSAFGPSLTDDNPKFIRGQRQRHIWYLGHNVLIHRHPVDDPKSSSITKEQLDASLIN